jgi:hypothetical protein
VSNLASTSDAVKAAVDAAKATLPDGKVATIAVVSATSERGGEAVATAFKEALGDIPFVGATSCGAVLTRDGPIAGGISVMLLSYEGVAHASGEFREDVFATSKRAAQDLCDGLGGRAVKAIYMASSPGNEEAVMLAIESVFGSDIAVLGGSAADNDVSGSWSVFHNGKAFGAGVAMFAVAGDGIKAGACLSSPYKPTETSLKVTEANGRSLIKLDGKPAADALFDLVGDTIAAEYEEGGMILGPMSIRPFALKRDGDYIAVHVAGIEQPAGTVNLFAEAAVGDELVQMENVCGGDAASAAGRAIKDSFYAAMKSGGLSSPAATFLVYCGGLGIAVGDALATNLTEDFASLPLPAAALGVTAFGEQGPTGPCNQHRNLSVGMLLLE